MTLLIDTAGSAREEIELTLEFNPPPDFRTTEQAVEWAEEQMPINTYFEVQGKNGRIWYQGHTRMPRR
jgi:hypothetical protein